jgi:hypothetical protein
MEHCELEKIPGQRRLDPGDAPGASRLGGAKQKGSLALVAWTKEYKEPLVFTAWAREGPLRDRIAPGARRLGRPLAPAAWAVLDLWHLLPR